MEDTVTGAADENRNTVSSTDTNDHARLPHERLRHVAATLRELSAARDIDAALQLAVDLAAELVTGVNAVDITLVRRGRVTTRVATDEVARCVGELQQQLGEGPCLDALDSLDPVVAHDLRVEHRWPVFAPAALDLGVRSVVAFPLYVQRGDEPPRRIGALNAFGPDARVADLPLELGRVFATHCATVLNAEISHRSLLEALGTRDVIGQAKGVLMERHGASADEAFAMLKRASNDLNLAVRELAERVVASRPSTTVE